MNKTFVEWAWILLWWCVGLLSMVSLTHLFAVPGFIIGLFALAGIWGFFLIQAADDVP